MKSSIVLTGGGTAGHVTGNLALYPTLKKHFLNIYYIGSNNSIEEKLIKSKTHATFYGISAVKLVRGKILVNLALPFKLLRAVKQAKKILKKLRPNVVFSKGGFVSVPVILAAKSLKIPIVCHESDLSMGLANKIGSRYATTVCTTFEKTAKPFKNKGVFTGSPLQKEFENLPTQAAAKHKLHLPADKKVLLVTGGSLGAAAINSAVRESLDALTKSFYVVHVTGKGNANAIKNAYYRQIEFATNMPDLIAAADVVISRAGSNTIFELAFANKPMLLIPLPKGASRGDQIENAEYFKQCGYAHVLSQQALTRASLISAVNETLKDASNLKNALKKSGLKNGTALIAKAIFSASDGKK